MLCFVANGLAELGDSVTVINLLEHPENAGRLNKKIPVIDIKTSQTRFISRIDQLLKLISAVRKIKPDIIIAFKYIPNYLAAFIGKLLKIPVIISERCDPAREYVFTGHARLYWKLINSADGGVFQTPGAMACYTDEMKKKGTVIPNPVVLSEEITHTVKNNDEAKIVVSVGRLSNVQKRYDIMLAAFKQFHEKNKQYILNIYGDGEDEELIQSWISESGMDDIVFLKGKTDKPLQVMDEADIFLTTSDYEGISNSLLEAMAIGMPVVATDCTPGGARLLVKDGENGILVPCGDEKLIANALDKMAKDYGYRCKCGKQAIIIRKEYSTQLIIHKWFEYIKLVIDTFQKT